MLTILLASVLLTHTSFECQMHCTQQQPIIPFIYLFCEKKTFHFLDHRVSCLCTHFHIRIRSFFGSKDLNYFKTVCHFFFASIYLSVCGWFLYFAASFELSSLFNFFLSILFFIVFLIRFRVHVQNVNETPQSIPHYSIEWLFIIILLTWVNGWWYCLETNNICMCTTNKICNRRCKRNTVQEKHFFKAKLRKMNIKLGKKAFNKTNGCIVPVSDSVYMVVLVLVLPAERIVIKPISISINIDFLTIIYRFTNDDNDASAFHSLASLHSFIHTTGHQKTHEKQLNKYT